MAWNPWPDFVPPPEYASKTARDLLVGIIDLAQAVPPSDPEYPDCQAAIQKAQELLVHQEADLAPLLLDWGHVADAYSLAEDGRWGPCRIELENF